MHFKNPVPRFQIQIKDLRKRTVGSDTSIDVKPVKGINSSFDCILETQKFHMTFNTFQCVHHVLPYKYIADIHLSPTLEKESPG
jgi:hypothetical protein